MTVDGETVYHRPSGDAFNVVAIDLSGPGWRPAMTAYFDDFTFAAAPTLELRVSQVQLSWESVSNVTYQVKYREALAGAEWAPLGGGLLGSGSPLHVTDEVQPGQPRRFYRVDIRSTP